MTEYHCKYCVYTTNDKAHYKRHNSTESHKNKVLDEEWELPNEPIADKEYTCETCGFVTVSKYNYTRHINSINHNKRMLGEPRNEKKNNNIYCCMNCNAEYSSASGLWRHKKKCSQDEQEKEKEGKEEEDVNTFMDSNRELIEFLLKENKEFKSMLMELAKNQNTNNNNNNTTNNNQKFNLNFFLNETCKDAVNFSDFMNTIKVTLEDLENTMQLGYVDGISRIFINALKNTDIEHRPLHCTDLKRETVYIKEGNKWDKDKDNMKRAVEFISNKNLGQIQEWKKENPEHIDSNHHKSDVLNTMYATSLAREPEREEKKIIKNVLNEVIVEKDIGEPS